ncbi:MAG: UvrD-helicase domain-containing protein [Treponema sp.]|jgi:ATP-dependent helicase/nuclease subunit A|nr:UvrD-helicase domain-containing protein [Treponema sp.]
MKELNEEQRSAAYRDKNAVVAAGAGSGKTLVLARRFVWLITDRNFKVDEILTLTFTRKAAAQMYRRIYETLGEIAAGDSGQRGEKARRALDDFVHARIQTLDSYSAALVRQAAPRYGVNPEFSVDEDRCRGMALEESLPFLIAHRHHPAIERLYLKKRPEKIAKEIFAETIFKYSRIDEKPNLTGDVIRQFDFICNEEWENQTKKIRDILSHISDCIKEDDDLLPGLAPLTAQYESGRIKIPDKIELRAYFDSLPVRDCIAEAEANPVYGGILRFLEFMSTLSRFNLQRGRRNNNPVKESIKLIREEIFGEFSSLAVFSMQAGLILSLMSLLENLQRRYLDRKRAEGVLTFGDVARLSRAVLRDQKDIRKSEKAAFKAIMIDEFQDNNELQKELLFLLAEKEGEECDGIPPPENLLSGKLFFVGDEKQSIYRFRGADVSVFRRLKEELGGTDISLRNNYRSSPELIGAFNALFGGSDFDPTGEKVPGAYPSIFAAASLSPSGESVPSRTGGFPAAGLLPPFEATYTPLRAVKGHKGFLTVCILDKKDEGNADDDENETGGGDSEAETGENSEEYERLGVVENEARFTAERIKQLLEEKDGQGGDKYEPDNIAVLFRNHTHQHVFEKHFRQLDIPYASETLNGFFQGGPVNDIMSMLRLVVYPLDTKTYAETLRSPFVGLSLSGLAICMASHNGAEPVFPFEEEPFSSLNDEDRICYSRGRDLYRQICDKASGETTSALVSELWYSLGYRYETEWNPQTVVYRELYDYLFHLAAQADEKNESLSSFVNFIQTLRENGERLDDIEIPLERPGAVHLLTIHKSKGLEFPVVFLCCCGRYNKRGGSAADIYDSGEWGLSFNPPLPSQCLGMKEVKTSFFRERSLNEENRKRTAELRRLLYVGMTRAETRLYLTGSLDMGGKKDETGGEPSEGNSGAGGQEGAADFSLRLKAFIGEKTAKAGSSIGGDLILDDDTFFGLCLPALVSHIPDEGLKKRPAFFDLEAIPVYSEEYIRQNENQGILFPNDKAGLNRFLEKAESFYRDAELIRTPEIPNNHRTPTSFSAEEFTAIFGGATEAAGSYAPSLAGGFLPRPDLSGADSADVFVRIDPVLGRFAEKGESENREKTGTAPVSAPPRLIERFGATDFGVIAHACVESLLNETEPDIPAKLAGHLSPAEAETMLGAGKELARRFADSPLGRKAAGAEMRKSEFPFRTLIKLPSAKERSAAGGVSPSCGGAAEESAEDLFISGTIDLLFEDESSVYVVDFKTDVFENPAEHAAQMAFYYHAASDLFGVPHKKNCRVLLYYLRTGHAFEAGR